MRYVIALAVCVIPLLPSSASARETDTALLVEAVVFLRQADAAEDPKREVGLLREARQRLQRIVSEHAGGVTARQLTGSGVPVAGGESITLASVDARLRPLCFAGPTPSCVLAAALEVARAIEDPFLRAWVLTGIAELQEKSGNPGGAKEILEEALGETRTVQSALDRTRVLAAVAVASPGRPADVLDGARYAARSVGDKDGKDRALGAVAVAEARTGRIDEALGTARGIVGLYWKSEALAAVAAAQAQAGQIEPALETARQIELLPSRGKALADVAAARAGHGQIEEALGAAREVAFPPQRARALASVAAVRAFTGQNEEAFDAAREIELPSWRAKALLEVAAVQAGSGDPGASTRLLREVARIAGSIEDVYRKVELLGAVAVVQAVAGREVQAARAFDDALGVARDIGDPYWKAQALGSVAAALSQAEARSWRSGVRGLAPRQAGTTFRDCAECPEMVVVPAGSFMMGSPESEAGRGDNEGPVHRVTIARPFAVGVYEVTFDEWDACVSDGGCGGYRPGDSGWGRGSRPVILVSWEDAKAYVEWLSMKTGEGYRLLSESEWEYVARAGTTGAYHFGSSIASSQANYGENRGGTVPVGSYPANGLGLHDVHGNVWEWVEDCWNDSYRGAPGDGSAWTSGNCSGRVLRGGSWDGDPRYLRSALRSGYPTGVRDGDAGFRVARTLTP